MKIKSLNGYFMFQETRSGQASEFMTVYGLDLFAKENYYTFEALLEAPKYSIVGKPYLGVPAIKTFEGQPWEVMKENKLVYNFLLQKVVPQALILDLLELKESGKFYLADGLIQPGSKTTKGLVITDYSAFFLYDKMQFRYSDVG